MVTQLHTVAEAAAILRLSRRQVERYVAAGRLRPIRFGRRVLFTQRELEAFVAQGRVA